MLTFAFTSCDTWRNSRLNKIIYKKMEDRKKEAAEEAERIEKRDRERILRIAEAFKNMPLSEKAKRMFIITKNGKYIDPKTMPKPGENLKFGDQMSEAEEIELFKENPSYKTVINRKGTKEIIYANEVNFSEAELDIIKSNRGELALEYDEWVKGVNSLVKPDIVHWSEKNRGDYLANHKDDDDYHKELYEQNSKRKGDLKFLTARERQNIKNLEEQKRLEKQKRLERERASSTRSESACECQTILFNYEANQKLRGIQSGMDVNKAARCRKKYGTAHAASLKCR
jgi:hypothetical protein